ncbi:MAG: hypothetical protein ACLFPF_08325 [Halanaerobiales bacterium]
MKIRSESGFTLLELLLIMIMLGTLISVTVPGLEKLKKSIVFKNELKVMAYTLINCRQFAINDSCRYYLKLIDNKTLGIYKTGTAGYLQIVKFDYINISSNFSNDKTSFGPMGTANNGTFYINSSVNNRRITIAVSGKVTIR